VQARADDGTWCLAQIVAVSKQKNRAQAPVKVNWVGYTKDSDVWLGAESLRSKKLQPGYSKLPEIYFGTMTFGWNQASSVVDDAVATTMTTKFLSSGCRQVDTARIYAGGDTETILGRVLQTDGVKGKRLVLATKVHPSQKGGLSASGIRDQLEASLKELQVPKVDVLYLHQPDPENDLVESLECIQSLMKEGKFAKYGLSNYSAIETQRCCAICKEKKWRLPSFYQGLYNPLNRLVEAELLPILRKNKISFVAYNPLAGGLLTGKHKADGEVQAGRFKDNPNYLPRFYTDANFKALTSISSACESAGLAMVPATYAWLLRNSALQSGDGLLIGASSMDQLEQNLEACKKPAELPAPVKEALDGAWPLTTEGAFAYWRSYSKDQPDREKLNPGAAYNAAKK